MRNVQALNPVSAVNARGAGKNALRIRNAPEEKFANQAIVHSGAPARPIRIAAALRFASEAPATAPKIVPPIKIVRPAARSVLMEAVRLGAPARSSRIVPAIKSVLEAFARAARVVVQQPNLAVFSSSLAISAAIALAASLASAIPIVLRGKFVKVVFARLPGPVRMGNPVQ